MNRSLLLLGSGLHLSRLKRALEAAGAQLHHIEEQAAAESSDLRGHSWAFIAAGEQELEWEQLLRRIDPLIPITLVPYQPTADEMGTKRSRLFEARREREGSARVTQFDLARSRRRRTQRLPTVRETDDFILIEYHAPRRRSA